MSSASLLRYISAAGPVERGAWGRDDSIQGRPPAAAPCADRSALRYSTYASSYLDAAKKYAHVPLKQAVISASALSLLYPQAGIAGYSREAFLDDLVREAEKDIRGCLDRGAAVQIDFTEGASGEARSVQGLLNAFVDLNNRVLERFTTAERSGSASTPARAGITTLPTVPTWTTPSSCRHSFASTPELLRPALERGRPPACARRSLPSTPTGTARSSSA